MSGRKSASQLKSDFDSIQVNTHSEVKTTTALPWGALWGPIGPYRALYSALYRALYRALFCLCGAALFSLCGLPYFPFVRCRKKIQVAEEDAGACGGAEIAAGVEPGLHSTAAG